MHKHPTPLAWLSTTLLAIASLLPLNAATANLVTNGDFAKGKSGWWGEGKWDMANQVLSVQKGFACQDKIHIDGGQRYQISFEAKGQGGYVQLSYRGEGITGGWYGPASLDAGWGQEKALVICTDSAEWKSYSVVVKAPQKANQALLYLRRLNKGEGVAQYRNVVMEPTEKEATRAAGFTWAQLKNGDFSGDKASWWGDGKWSVEAGVMKVVEGFACQDKIAVEPGKRYKLSMRIKSEGAPVDAVYVQASYRGDGASSDWIGASLVRQKWGAERALIVTGGTQDWSEVSCVIAVPKNAETLLIYLRKKAKTEGAGFFDDVKLVETLEPETTAAQLRRKVLAQEVFAGAPGNGDYTISVAPDCDLVVLHAAKELATYLGQVTGKTYLPLVQNSASTQAPLLVVGRENPLVAKLCPNVDWKALGQDGYILRTVGQHLVIAGATSRGTMYGINGFLDHYVGVKWFAPDFTVVPHKATLALPAIQEIQIPRFKYREVFSSEGHDDAYDAHNRINGRSHGRSFSPSAPELGNWESWWTAKGGDANFWGLLGEKAKSHPEWMAGGQVAMMNSDMRQAMADEIISRLRRLDDYRSVVFNIHDMDWGWDMDPASLAFAQKHGGVPSAPRLDMVIDIANRVRRVLPEARFSFNPYHWSFTPPQGMTVPEYILPFPMTIHVDYSAPLNGEANKKLGQDLVGWTKISKHVLVWDHTVNFFGFLQPTPNIYPICQTIQWLATLDPVMGYFAEDSWMTPGAEHAALRTWVIARLLWDPKQDYRALVKEFVEGYYGPAAPFMMQYIDLSYASMIKTGDTFREKTTVVNQYVNLDFVIEADKLFEQAHAAVKDNPEFLRHVETTRMAVDCPVLIRRAEFAEAARKRNLNWTPDTEARTARLFANWDAAKVREYIQGGNLKELKDLLTIERKTPEVPDLAQGLPATDWIDFQDLAFTRYGSKIVADPAASDGAAIRLDGNNGVWAVQLRRYKLPREGNWDLYAAVRIDKGGKGTDADLAVNIGLSPPMGRFNSGTVGELGDGVYHWIKVPGSPMTYAQEDEQLMYVQPRQNMTKYIYIDRVVAIRHKP